MTFTGFSGNAADTDAKSGSSLTNLTPSVSDLDWYVVNDSVMGGRSEGDFKQEDGSLHFAGNTNTTGGGFSSIRTKSLQLNLANHAGIELYLKGDGRRYTWQLTTTARRRGRQVSYWADFETREGQWSTVNIPFSRFVPKHRGTVLDGPPLDTQNITGMGLMIYDKVDGPFDMRLAKLSAYSEQTPFALEQFQWKNRVLVLSASDKNSDKLKEQLSNVASTSEAFKDRDMVLVTLIDASGSTADEQELTTSQTIATRSALGIRPGSFTLRLIGKDGSVKLSSESVTSMKDIYSLIDSMPMRQRENEER